VVKCRGPPYYVVSATRQTPGKSTRAVKAIPGTLVNRHWLAYSNQPDSQKTSSLIRRNTKPPDTTGPTRLTSRAVFTSRNPFCRYDVRRWEAAAGMTENPRVRSAQKEPWFWPAS